MKSVKVYLFGVYGCGKTRSIRQLNGSYVDDTRHNDRIDEVKAGNLIEHNYTIDALRGKHLSNLNTVIYDVMFKEARTTRFSVTDPPGDEIELLNSVMEEKYDIIIVCSGISTANLERVAKNVRYSKMCSYVVGCENITGEKLRSILTNYHNKQKGKLRRSRKFLSASSSF